MKASRSDLQTKSIWARRPVPSLHIYLCRHISGRASFELLNKFLNICLDVVGDTDLAGLADEVLGVEVPARIASAGGVAHELPHLGGGVTNDTTKLHNDAVVGEVLLGGEGGDLLVASELLPPELLGREGEDDKVVAELAKILEPRVFTRGRASSGRNIGGVHHLALKRGRIQGGSVALDSGEILQHENDKLNFN